MTDETLQLTILTPEAGVTPFMTPERLRMIKTLGFASVINTMSPPDSALEAIGEQDIARRVRKASLEYRSVFVNSADEIDDDLIARFQEAVAEVPKPAVIFSRKGKRALAIWTVAMENGQPSEETALAAIRMDQDLSDITTPAPFMNKRAA